MKSEGLWRDALLVFCVALVFRTLYLLEARTKPEFSVLNMDPQYNYEWAQCIARGAWPPPYDRLKDAAFFRAPLYSYSLAGMMKLFGESQWLIRAIQIVIGSISCVLTLLLANRYFGRMAGLFSGLFCAIYWVLAYFDSKFLLTVPLVFFSLLGFLLLAHALDRSSLALAGAAGLALGLNGITRADILPFYPVLVVWFLWASRESPRRKALVMSALLAAGCLLPSALVTLRNRAVSGDWVVVASQGGVNFYIGNNPESNGMQAVVPHTRHTWWGGYEDTVAIAEKAASRKLKASEVSSFWYQRAFAYIRERPADWIRLTARKALAFIGSVEIPNNEPYEARRPSYRTLSAIPLNFGLLFGLFLVGLPRMFRSARSDVRRGDLPAREAAPLQGGRMPATDRFAGIPALMVIFIAVYSVTIVGFFVTSRYRVPLIPFLAIGAGAGVAWMWELLKRKRVIGAVAALLLAALVTGLLGIDWFGTRASTLAWARFAEAQDKIALRDFDGAIRILDEIRVQRSIEVPEVYTSLMRAYVTRGNTADRDALLRLSEEGVQRHPDTDELQWYAAGMNMEVRNWKRASELIGHFLVTHPGDMQGLRMAFFAALSDNRPQEAANWLARAEAVDSASPATLEMRQALQNAGTRLK